MRVTIKVQTSLRERQRLVAKRRIQQAALPLFEKRGFAEVTIEEIAAAAQVGPATVYRHFGTKEQLVLWDEYDPMLLDELAAALPGRALAEALLVALTVALGEVYERDRARILRRARLMQESEALTLAATRDQRQLRAALASLLLRQRRAKDGLSAAVLAGALTAVLEAGVEDWLAQGGKRPLRASLQRACKALDALTPQL